MLANYTIWLCGPSGYRVGIMHDTASVRLTRTVNDVSALELVVPPYWREKITLPDSIIEVWRSPGGGTPAKCEGVFFVRGFARSRGENNTETFTIYGAGLNSLLRYRVVAYLSGTANADITDNGDDIMREIVRQNLGSTAGTGRALSALTVEPNMSYAADQSRYMAGQTVLDVLRDIASAAYVDGTTLFFGIDPSGFNPLTLYFRVAKNHWGIDHGTTSGSRVTLSPEAGSLAGATLLYDYNEEVTAVRGLGSGVGPAQLTQTAVDTARANASQWNRREITVQDTGLSLNPAVLDMANAALRAGTPRKRLTASILQIPGTAYGREYWFGDKIVVAAFGEVFDCYINAVSIGADTGGESIDARIEATG